MKDPLFSVVAVSCAVVLTIAVYKSISEKESRHLEDMFHRQAAEKSLVLSGHIEKLKLIVSSLQHFFYASEKVEREEFDRFATPFERDVPSVVALEWIPLVSAQDRLTFEAETRAAQENHPEAANELASFQIKEIDGNGNLIPAKERDEYFPVHYVAPFKDGNKSVLGFDLGADPARFEALSKARQSGELCITERVSLVQGSESGFLMYLPVFKRSSSTEPINEDPANLHGFVLVVFKTQEIVNHALKAFSGLDEMEIFLLDRTGGSRGDLLAYFPHRSDAGSKELAQVKQRLLARESGLSHSHRIAVGNRLWQVVGLPGSIF